MPGPTCGLPYLLLVPGRVLHVHQNFSLPGASSLHSELCPLLYHVARGLNACPGRVRKPWVGRQGHPLTCTGSAPLPIPF